MKDLRDIITQDLTEKFTRAYKEINELRDYLHEKYGIQEGETTPHSKGEVNFRDVLEVLNTTETTIRKIILNYNKK